MEDDGLGDWRHRAVTTLAKDVPEAYPGGPSHKAGTPVYVSTLTRDPRGNIIGFTVPSPAALALNISIQSAKRADILKGELEFRRETTYLGPGRGVPPEQATRLFDFFEQCMMAVTFSFNALEVFSNQTIADELKATYPMTRGRKEKHLDADEVQRQISTEEKLSSVLPSILRIDSPGDKPVWADFKRLQRARNATIHMKAAEAYSRGKIHEQSLFEEFFSMPSQMGYAIFAIEVIGHFTKPGEQEPRWLAHARQLAETLKKAKKPRG